MSYNDFYMCQSSESDKLSYVSNLKKELFYLWNFIAQEGLLDNAAEFLEDHLSNMAPLSSLTL